MMTITKLTVLLEDGTTIDFRYNQVTQTFNSESENLLAIPSDKLDKAEQLAMSIFKSKY